MYLRAIKTYGLNPNIPTEIKVPFHESVYKAATQPDMPAYLPFDAIARVDQPISLVAEARHQLYNGDPEQARIKLNNVLHLTPDYPEARLVSAELLTRNGKTAEAKLILNDLIANIGNPEWIQAEAQSQLERMP
jgi:predicted Zn-dependent protease